MRAGLGSDLVKLLKAFNTERDIERKIHRAVIGKDVGDRIKGRWGRNKLSW